MIRQTVKIKNPTGLHLSPAGLLCKVAMQFESKITFQTRNSNGNAKSVLSILGACVKTGDDVEFIFEGEDEEEAAREIIGMIENGLGE